MTHHGAHLAWAAGVLPPVVVLLGYLRLARRARRRNPVLGWSRWRTASFATGVALVAAALLPPVASFAHADFRGHMAQHMLIGMYAPIGLVLGAPVTLLLRTLPVAGARRLTAVVHSRACRVVAHPVTAVLLSTGSLGVLYLTPLYEAAVAHPAGHWLLHAHFLLSGCLFAYVIAGPDPAPARPGVRARLVCLGCAIAVHAIVAQLMYGGFWVDVRAPVAEVRGGAEIMYYGGDIAELLLAFALVATWRPDRRHRSVRFARGGRFRKAHRPAAAGAGAGR
ncbi:cytochrome c oxidase assembly protein [Microbispora sp. H11081]|uniref:cytochrome c oxidase assembly protein n=1 Tax=Microbispora sp. H11081 TaxID=2729107 RepID=UPI001472D1F7|nr:cytochrome c oxidase assembly protein [Microbispora sp. H11081]